MLLNMANLLVTAFRFVNRDAVQQTPSASPHQGWSKYEGSRLGGPSAQSLSPTELAHHKAASPDGHFKFSLVHYSLRLNDNQVSVQTTGIKKEQIQSHFLLLTHLLIFPFSFRHWIMNQRTFLYVNQFANNICQLLKNLSNAARFPKPYFW